MYIYIHIQNSHVENVRLHESLKRFEELITNDLRCSSGNIYNKWCLLLAVALVRIIIVISVIVQFNDRCVIKTYFQKVQETYIDLMIKVSRDLIFAKYRYLYNYQK